MKRQVMLHEGDNPGYDCNKQDDQALPCKA